MRKDSEGVIRHPELARAMGVKCSAEISLGSYMELKESNEELFIQSVKKHVVTVESIQMGVTEAPEQLRAVQIVIVREATSPTSLATLENHSEGLERGSPRGLDGSRACLRTRRKLTPRAIGYFI